MLHASYTVVSEYREGGTEVAEIAPALVRENCCPWIPQPPYAPHLRTGDDQCEGMIWQRIRKRGSRSMVTA